VRFGRRDFRLGRIAGSAALTLTAMMSMALGAPTAQAAPLVPAPAAQPCYNIVRHEGTTTHLEVWYSCGSLAVYRIRTWLTRPIGPLQVGHFQLTHGGVTIANSAERHWLVNQPYEWDGTFTSPRGQLVCTTFWVVTRSGPHQRFGSPNCVTR
jgi:hypothetical protein